MLLAGEVFSDYTIVKRTNERNPVPKLHFWPLLEKILASTFSDLVFSE